MKTVLFIPNYWYHSIELFQEISIDLGDNVKKVFLDSGDPYFQSSKGNRYNLDDFNKYYDAVVALEYPYKHDIKWELGFDIFKNFYSRTQGLRRLGAASLDLCFVAMGRFEGFYEFNLEIWDICAGIVIAQEAGANVSDWDGTKPPLSGNRILCTNKLIHKEMIEILMNKKYSIFFKKNT